MSRRLMFLAFALIAGALIPSLPADAATMNSFTLITQLSNGATAGRLAPALARASYQVRCREFDGPHVIPSAIAHEAVDWLLDAHPRAERRSGVQS